MRAKSNLNRREFLKVSAAAGAGLVIGIYLPACGGLSSPTPEATAEPTATSKPTLTPEPTAWFEPNIHLKIDNNGLVTITAFRSEMGQGIRTAIAMIVLEELDADWSALRIEQAPADSAFGNQVTGGSVSISTYYSPLRRAGALARHLLIAAAAQEWGVEPESCHTERGSVIHSTSDRRLAYGQLVETAATIPILPLADIPLKEPKDFQIIGTSTALWDVPQMVNGNAIYGLDVRLPNMLYATIARCPVFGGEALSFDDTTARAVAGVQDIIEIDSGIAVVAENTWAAIKGREALEIVWDSGRNADLSSADIRQKLLERAPKPGEEIAADATMIEATYEIPYLAHATMEPMNCVADVRTASCEVWASTQDPQAARLTAQAITKLPRDSVTVHVPFIGGGFGRRLGVDYVSEAVKISSTIGAPVKVMWTRQDDLQHDLYFPFTYQHVSGKPDKPDKISIRAYPARGGVPSGYWRAVTNISGAFAHECFLDELAAVGDRDPVELRLEALSKQAGAVVELAATKADWGTPMPPGWGRGIAYHATWGKTHVAQVAEVSVAKNGIIRVHRVVCALDCGIVINPDTVEAQMEGGIVFGLTAALKEGITIKNGRTQQSNFHDYPLLPIDEMPAIEVYIIPSDKHPQGIGEMGVPPIAPAVANAVFAATGKRIRRLPIRPEDLRAD